MARVFLYSRPTKVSSDPHNLAVMGEPVPGRIARACRDQRSPEPEKSEAGSLDPRRPRRSCGIGRIRVFPFECADDDGRNDAGGIDMHGDDIAIVDKARAQPVESGPNAGIGGRAMIGAEPTREIEQRLAFETVRGVEIEIGVGPQRRCLRVDDRSDAIERVHETGVDWPEASDENTDVTVNLPAPVPRHSPPRAGREFRDRRTPSLASPVARPAWIFHTDPAVPVPNSAPDCFGIIVSNTVCRKKLSRSRCAPPAPCEAAEGWPRATCQTRKRCFRRHRHRRLSRARRHERTERARRVAPPHRPSIVRVAAWLREGSAACATSMMISDGGWIDMGVSVVAATVEGEAYADLSDGAPGKSIPSRSRRAARSSASRRACTPWDRACMAIRPLRATAAWALHNSRRKRGPRANQHRHATRRLGHEQARQSAVEIIGGQETGLALGERQILRFQSRETGAIEIMEGLHNIRDALETVMALHVTPA